MLRLSELKLPLDHGEEALQEAVLKRLRIPPDRLLGQTLSLIHISEPTRRS